MQAVWTVAFVIATTTICPHCSPADLTTIAFNGGTVAQLGLKVLGPARSARAAASDKVNLHSVKFGGSAPGPAHIGAVNAGPAYYAALPANNHV